MSCYHLSRRWVWQDRNVFQQKYATKSISVICRDQVVRKNKISVELYNLLLINECVRVGTVSEIHLCTA